MKPKLLVVDDDRSVRESLTKLLSEENYEVHPVRDGTDALEFLRANSADLVILDLNLGADDGWNVFQKMADLNPFVPTVIITAEFDQLERAIAAGVEALVEKPIDVPVFLKTIGELLAETNQQRLERICGDERYCRYVERNPGVFRYDLENRYSTPLRIARFDRRRWIPNVEQN